MLLKVCLILTLVSAVLHSSACGDMEEKPNASTPCRQIVARIVKRQLAEITTCINTMQFKNKKDRANKLACIIKCVGIREKIIAPDGKFDQAHADAFMEREIPANYLPFAKTLLQKCFDIGVGMVDPNEEYCHSYKPAIKCIMDEVTNLCEVFLNFEYHSCKSSHSDFIVEFCKSSIPLMVYKVLNIMDPRLIAITLLCIVNFTNSQEIDVHACKREVAKTVKRQLALISVCINEMKFENKKDRSAKLACIVKCAAIHEKLLTPEGALSKDAAIAFIENLPPFLHPRASKMMEGCLALAIGEKAPDMEEMYCRTYTPYIKCFMEGTTNLCKEPKKPKTGAKAGPA
ncbi:unnamed protein product [Allacma fusca]|uniref:Uncharacterized protein n=1 Tax=Allacma fusca TaxID=39272 RepID=A0A8J2JFS1_9HEXA|nr:unnamed protein product [Allacma fusca]